MISTQFLFESISDENFKQMLIQQEIWMYNKLGEQVDPDEFDELCQRRGFNDTQKEELKLKIIESGLGDNLK